MPEVISSEAETGFATEADADAFLDQAEGQAGTQAVKSEVKPTEPSGTAATPSTETPEYAAKISALEKQLTAFQREAGQGRALQAKFDALEKKLAQQENKTTVQLTPEQQSEQEQIKRQILDIVREGFKDQLSMADQQKVQAQQFAETQAYRNDLVNLCDEFQVPFAELNPIMVKIVQEADATAKAGDSTKLDRILGPGGQHYLFTIATRQREQEVNTAGQNFQQGKANAAQKAGQTVKSSNRVQSTAPRKLEDVDLNDKSLTESALDEMLDAAGVR